MADPLSMSASCFAVVQIVDVVLRAAKDTYEFFGSLKDAPQDIQKLREIILQIRLLVTEVNSYLRDLDKPVSPSASLPSVATSTSASTQLLPTLRSLKRELDELIRLTRKYNGVTTTWNRFKYTFDDKKINKSLQNLEGVKTTLIAALVLAGRRGENKQLSNIELLVQQGSLSMMSSNNSIIRSFDQKTEMISDHVSHTQTDIKDHILMQHHETRALMQESLETICTRIQDLPANLTQPIKVVKKNHRQIRFIGTNLESALGLLILLKPQIHSVILDLLTHHGTSVSAGHLTWLRTEFANLATSTTREVSAIYDGPIAAQTDAWVYSSNTASETATEQSQEHRQSRKRSRETTGDDDIQRTPATSSVNRRRRRMEIRQTFTFALPLGTLSITIPSTADDDEVAMSTCNEQEEISLSFMPRSGLATNLIQAYFRRRSHRGQDLHLYAQLNSFIVADPTHEFEHYGTLLRGGSLQSIDSAIRRGTVSPYAFDECGSNLFFRYAAWYCRMDLFEYYDTQGIGPASLQGEHGALSAMHFAYEDGLDLIIPKQERTTRLKDKVREDFLKLIRYFERFAEAQALTMDKGLFHPICCSPDLNYNNELVMTARRWLIFLQQQGYDLDQEVEGEIALLEWAKLEGGRSLEMCRLLLEFGANVQVVDSHGLNVLHRALRPGLREGHSRILTQRLCLFIEAGADVNQCDALGFSPSDCAALCYRVGDLSYNCGSSAKLNHVGGWDQWCQALEMNGLSIQDVLRRDIELHGTIDERGLLSDSELDSRLGEKRGENDSDDEEYDNYGYANGYLRLISSMRALKDHTDERSVRWI